ncbi:MAG: hypothetical protein WB789_05290 [Thermoplasmata archaeon]
MTNCQDVFNFLTGVSRRSTPPALPDADVASLQQSNLVRRLSAEEYAQITRNVAALSATQEALAAEQAQRSELAARLQDDYRKSHSILFRLEGREKQDAILQREASEQAKMRDASADIATRDQTVDQMIAQESLLGTLAPYGDGYVGLTSTGAMALRDLGVRLYRVSDLPFAEYWQQSQQVTGELNTIAGKSGQYFGALSPRLGGSDRSGLWSIAVGLAKREGDVATLGSVFLDAYARIGGLSHNDENRLMAAELISTLPTGVAESIPLLTQLEHDVRKADVPKESSLGVASILLLGRRADGTFATANLPGYLRITRSYESAALLAIVNRPFDELGQKFQQLRAMFSAWGFQPSEDVELASSYLAVSDLPAEGINAKLAIISKGMSTYLQYPLVASSILASIPVLEANDTLNLLEQAYGIIGRTAGGLSQAELICLAVRMIHGIRTETVTGVDTTATAVPAAVRYYAYGPMYFFVPLIIAHGAYYSTYSGLGGAHPGHAHFVGGGFTG